MRNRLLHVWEKSGYNVEKQQVLKDFFKELLEGSMMKIGQWVGSGLSVFFQVIFLWMPYQTLDGDFKILWWCCLYFAGCGCICYMSPYMNYKEGNRLVRIVDKLKFVPISSRDLFLFRFKKLIWFCIRVFFVSLVGQLFFAVVFCHGLVWGNLLYPLILGLLLPVGIGSLFVKGLESVGA